MKIIVFDLGGTLMEYKGMPHSWIAYYEECFHAVNRKHTLNLSKEDIAKSVEILKKYNPRYIPREIEYSSEFLFGEAIRHWDLRISLEDIITSFFSEMELSAIIYDDTIPTILQLKEIGYKVAALTNLPSSMPDRIFKKDIPEILSILDLYVSSEICGFRKPNIAGLQYIANYFHNDMESIIFVGDEKLDIETAKNAKCTSILINRNQKECDYNQEFTIKSLKDIFYLSCIL